MLSVCTMQEQCAFIWDKRTFCKRHSLGNSQFFQGCTQIADEAHSVRHRHITTEAAGGDDSV